MNDLSVRNVLMIAYDFPPRGGSGVQRVLKFAKYFPDFDWSPIVVCPDWQTRGSQKDDQTLTSEIPAEALVTAGPPAKKIHPLLKRVSRLRGGDYIVDQLRTNFAFPDGAGEWRTRALAYCNRLFESRPIHCMYSTSPPVTTQWIGLQLKRKFGIPWVVDLRDPWMKNPLRRKYWKWREERERRLEAEVYSAADWIIVTTRNSRELLINECDVDAAKVAIIPNGYDEEDFALLNASPPKEVFRICYCGAYYPGYEPAPIVAALQDFLKVEKNAKVVLTFAGTCCQWVTENISQDWMSEYIELHGYIPHSQVPHLLARSHIVVCHNPKHGTCFVPGKVYEQIRSSRHILAICEKGSDLDSLISESRSGESFTHNDIQGMAAFLQKHYTRWRDEKEYSLPDQSNFQVSSFERRELTGKLARLMLELLDSEL